jgi:nucleoid DNA-binding protein
MIKADYIAEIHSELGDFQVTKTAVRAFLEAQRKVLERYLKKHRQVSIPNVLKIKLVNTPPKAERLARNPSNGEPLIIAARPASKKLKVLFLTEFKIGVGAIGSISVQKSLEKRKAAEPIKAQKAARERAISKLSPEELEALGLGELAGTVPKRKHTRQAVETVTSEQPPLEVPEPNPPVVHARTSVAHLRSLEVVPKDREPKTLVERIVCIMKQDTIEFDTICARLEAHDWLPQRRSSISNIMSGRRDLFESPQRSFYRVR